MAKLSKGMSIIMDPSTIENCMMMYLAKKRSAENQGKVFSLSFLSFVNIKRQTVCAYSGEEFASYKDMSLERIDNSLGYVDGNVVPVTHEINNIRGSLDLSNIDKVIEEQYQYMVNNQYAKEYVVNPSNTSNKRILNSKLYTKYMTYCKLYETAKASYNDQLMVVENHKKMYDEKHEANSEKWGLNIQKSIKLSTAKAKKRGTIVDQYEKLIRKLIESAPLYKNSTTVEERKLFEAKSRYIKASRLHKNLVLAKKGLQRFENLSTMDTKKLKLGLPLESSSITVLKEVAARRLLQGDYNG